MHMHMFMGMLMHLHVHVHIHISTSTCPSTYKYNYIYLCMYMSIITWHLSTPDAAGFNVHISYFPPRQRFTELPSPTLRAAGRSFSIKLAWTSLGLEMFGVHPHNPSCWSKTQNRIHISSHIVPGLIWSALLGFGAPLMLLHVMSEIWQSNLAV